MDALPADVLNIILAHLKPLVLLRQVSFVCKRLRQAALRAVTAHHFASAAAAFSSPLASNLFGLLPNLSSVSLAFQPSDPSTGHVVLPPSVTHLAITRFASPLARLTAPSLTSISIANPHRQNLLPLLSPLRLALRSISVTYYYDVFDIDFPLLDTISLPPLFYAPGPTWLARHATQLTRMELLGHRFTIEASRQYAAMPFTRLAVLCLEEFNMPTFQQISALLQAPSLRELTVLNCPSALSTPLSLLTALVAFEGRAAELQHISGLPRLRQRTLNDVMRAGLHTDMSATTFDLLTQVKLQLFASHDPIVLWTTLAAAHNLTRVSVALYGRLGKPPAQRRRGTRSVVLAVSFCFGVTYGGQAEDLGGLVHFIGCVESVELLAVAQETDWAPLVDLAFELTAAGVDFTAEALSVRAAAAMTERCKRNVGRISCVRPSPES